MEVLVESPAAGQVENPLIVDDITMDELRSSRIIPWDGESKLSIKLIISTMNFVQYTGDDCTHTFCLRENIEEFESEVFEIDAIPKLPTVPTTITFLPTTTTASSINNTPRWRTSTSHANNTQLINDVEKNVATLKGEYEKAASVELQQGSEAIPIFQKILRVKKELYEHWCSHKTHLVQLRDNSWQFTPAAIHNSLTGIIREARSHASTCSKDVIEDEMRALASIRQEKVLAEEQQKKEEFEKEERENERRRKEEEEKEAQEKEMKARQEKRQNSTKHASTR